MVSTVARIMYQVSVDFAFEQWRKKDESLCMILFYWMGLRETLVLCYLSSEGTQGSFGSDYGRARITFEGKHLPYR